MHHTSPPCSGAFNILPIELNKAIAHELDTDRDIATYRLICRVTNDAIDADDKSFWRVKYRENYALKEGLSNARLARTYQNRAKQLRRGIGYDFFRGHKKREVDVVEVLRDLIVESFQGSFELDEYSRPRCKNQTRLIDFILNSKILLNDRRAPAPARGEPVHVNPMLAAVKLMCSHFLFDLESMKHYVFAIEQSQRAVYLSTNAAPIYKGLNLTDVNMDWVLHCLNFFRHHMMNEEAATLFDNINELPMTQKPSAWRKPLREGAHPLGQHWKGTYSFLDPSEVKKIRKLGPDEVGDDSFIDKNVEEGRIQSLELDFVQGGQRQLKWPAVFEERLRSLRYTSTTQPPIKTQGRSRAKIGTIDDPVLKNVQFVGRGEDLDDDFNAIGWLNSLPPQAGIPGWQRITFMKHFMDDFDQVDQDNLWAYEGVVLPGGRIILGRWWYASEQVNFNIDYNGPFILWAIDPEPKLEDDSDDD
ncbi:Nn.00g016870.m01.CDS01 [Neocucurbitaria sp. VM-36]